MEGIYRGSAWSIEPAPGWSVEERHDDDYPYVALVPPSGDALLRLTDVARGLRQAGMDAAYWVRITAEVHRPRGRPVIPMRCGDFSGHETHFATGDGRWLRGWALAAGSLPLDATYTCTLPDAGRDDAEVDAMLRTLRRVTRWRRVFGRLTGSSG